MKKVFKGSALRALGFKSSLLLSQSVQVWE